MGSNGAIHAGASPESAIGAVAVLMLGGGIRPSPLGFAAGGSVLDLHVAPDTTLLQMWRDRWRHALGNGALIRCLVAQGAAPPRSAPEGVVVEIDRRDYCGPAGAVRDAVELMDDGTLLAVHEGASHSGCDVGEALRTHIDRGADASVCMNADGSPAGMYFCRAEHFREVSRVGFTDLKEQLLPRLRSRGVQIGVIELPGAGITALRQRAAFLGAAIGPGAAVFAPASRLEPTIVGAGGDGRATSVVSAAATIASSARIVQSVIMPSVRVDEGAVVVRSLVCSGAALRPGARIVDAVVTTEGVRDDAWATARARWRQRA